MVFEAGAKHQWVRELSGADVPVSDGQHGRDGPHFQGFEVVLRAYRVRRHALAGEQTR